VVEQGGQDGPVPDTLDGFLGGCDEQFARLMVGNGRCFTLVGFRSGALLSDGLFLGLLDRSVDVMGL
jgi:hypothetical protein